MDNVIEFPNSKVTVKDILEDLVARAEAGEIQYLLIATMGPNTNTKCAMTTMPAHNAVFMNNMQRITIESLMRDNGMLP